MRYLKQTILDFERGNCWSTSIACLLDLEIGDVPNFCAKDSDTFEGEVRLDWYRRTVLWLAERGYGLVTFNFPTKAESGLIPPEGPALITGPSPRNQEKLHVVVGTLKTAYRKLESGEGWGHSFDLTMDHDPHPDGSFLGNGDPVEVSVIVRLA